MPRERYVYFSKCWTIIFQREGSRYVGTSTRFNHRNQIIETHNCWRMFWAPKNERGHQYLDIQISAFKIIEKRTSESISYNKMESDVSFSTLGTVALFSPSKLYKILFSIYGQTRSFCCAVRVKRLDSLFSSMFLSIAWVVITFKSILKWCRWAWTSAVDSCHPPLLLIKVPASEQHVSHPCTRF